MSNSGYVTKLRGIPIVSREYACLDHGPFDVEVPRETSQDPRPCPTCGATSERTIETRTVTVIAISVESGRGKSDPPPPYAMNTRKLYEGQSLGDYRAERRALFRDRDRAEAKQKGLLR